MSAGRVALIVTLALSILAAPLLADAQQAAQVLRRGYLSGSPPSGARLSTKIEAAAATA